MLRVRCVVATSRAEEFPDAPSQKFAGSDALRYGVMTTFWSTATAAYSTSATPTPGRNGRCSHSGGGWPPPRASDPHPPPRTPRPRPVRDSPCPRRPHTDPAATTRSGQRLRGDQSPSVGRGCCVRPAGGGPESGAPLGCPPARSSHRTRPRLPGSSEPADGSGRTSEDHEHMSNRIWCLTCGNAEEVGGVVLLRRAVGLSVGFSGCRVDHERVAAGMAPLPCMADMGNPLASGGLATWALPPSSLVWDHGTLVLSTFTALPSRTAAGTAAHPCSGLVPPSAPSRDPLGEGSVRGSTRVHTLDLEIGGRVTTIRIDRDRPS